MGCAANVVATRPTIYAHTRCPGSQLYHFVDGVVEDPKFGSGEAFISIVGSDGSHWRLVFPAPSLDDAPPRAFLGSDV
jgi:hypothetical protein